MRPLLLLVLVASVLTGCGRSASTGPADAGVMTDGGRMDHGDGGLTPCLDRPTNLAQPPTGPLPCELLPPDPHFGH